MAELDARSSLSLCTQPGQDGSPFPMDAGPQPVSANLHQLPEVHLMMAKAHGAPLRCEGTDSVQRCTLLFPQSPAPGCFAIITAGLSFKLDIVPTRDEGYHAEKHRAKFTVCSLYQQTHCKPFLSFVSAPSGTCKVQTESKLVPKRRKVRQT